MTRVNRDDILAALRAEDVADRLGICALGDQRWRGRWLRVRRCARTDHGSDAFGLARDGMWHCWACDQGGDLLALIAASENIDIRADFGRVLEIAAEIAGVDTDEPPDMFAPPRPVRKARPAPPPQPPIDERIAVAKKRAAWAWDRLHDSDTIRMPQMYLKLRGLDAAFILTRETIKSTPLRIPKELRAAIEAKDPSASEELRTLWWTMGMRVATLGIVVQVRCVSDDRPVDLRARRIEPPDGVPKIIGMVGGVTASPAERGKTRQLIGCYGFPHSIDSDLVVCTEGLMDYLTALQVWPDAHVLGAVEAGSLSLVVAHAAQALGRRDAESKLIVVEQNDPPRVTKDGRTVAGAADQAVNEDPNSAAKEAVRLLGPGRVGWLHCSRRSYMGVDVPGPSLADVKDLNDLWRAGADIPGMVVWWEQLASTE